MKKINSVRWDFLFAIKDLPDFGKIKNKVDVVKAIQQAAIYFRNENDKCEYLYKLLQHVIEEFQPGWHDVNDLFRYFLCDEKSLNIISEFMDKNNIELSEETVTTIISPEHIHKPCVQAKLINASEDLMLKGIGIVKNHIPNLLEGKGSYNNAWLEGVASVLNKRVQPPKEFLNARVGVRGKSLKNQITFKFQDPVRTQLIEKFQKSTEFS